MRRRWWCQTSPQYTDTDPEETTVLSPRSSCYGPAPMTDSDDEKYITFNRAEFFAMLHDVGATRLFKRSEMLSLDDAVVIRRQDLFASPCLSTYASMIALVANNIDNDERA